MQNNKKPAFITLLLMISFASVNAVLFTPALPSIADYFAITPDTAQRTITWFLIAYTVGQLIYGPLTNRFGHKRTLYAGISLQIMSSLLCLSAGYTHTFLNLEVGRFFLALGSGVGLKMAYTLVNEWYEPKAASQKISYLLISFAITPGLGVALGGILNTHFGWISCFYAGILYGLILLMLVIQLPETHAELRNDALQLTQIIAGYREQLKNPRLVVGGFLMGYGTAFIYIFAAVAPFIAIKLQGMTSMHYGLASLLPPIGIILGSLCSAKLIKHYSLIVLLRLGIVIAGLGVGLMIIALLLQGTALTILFLPMIITYCGLAIIFANASTLAMEGARDKANASCMMSFINMGFASVSVYGLKLFSLTVFLLPAMYVSVWCLMLGSFIWLVVHIAKSKVELEIKSGIETT